MCDQCDMQLPSRNTEGTEGGVSRDKTMRDVWVRSSVLLYLVFFNVKHV